MVSFHEHLYFILMRVYNGRSQRAAVGLFAERDLANWQYPSLSGAALGAICTPRRGSLLEMRATACAFVTNATVETSAASQPYWC